MFLLISYVFLSMGASLVTYFSYSMQEDWTLFYVPIVLSIAFFLSLLLLHALYCSLFSLFIKEGHKYKPNKYAMWIISETAYLICLFLRIKVVSNGLEKLPRDTSFMLATNHLSGLDHICLMSLLAKVPMVCVSKLANANIPVAGKWLTYAGYLTIIQGDLIDGKKVMEEASSLLESSTTSICIAPEGTRNKNYPNPILLPFHPGSFSMAKEAKKPIVIASIQNTQSVFKRFPFHKTKVYIDVLEVLFYNDYKDMSLNEISTCSRNLIIEHLKTKEARQYH